MTECKGADKEHEATLCAIETGAGQEEPRCFGDGNW